MKHRIISFNPFRVEYINGNLSKIVEYSVPLLNMEIKAEYDYIVFDEPLKVKKYGDELLFMEGHKILFNLN